MRRLGDDTLAALLGDVIRGLRQGSFEFEAKLGSASEVTSPLFTVAGLRWRWDVQKSGNHVGVHVACAGSAACYPLRVRCTITIPSRISSSLDVQRTWQSADPTSGSRSIGSEFFVLKKNLNRETNGYITGGAFRVCVDLKLLL